MHHILRGLLFVILLFVGIECAKMTYYGSAMSSFTNDHVGRLEPYIWALTAVACFIAPLWALIRPKRNLMIAGLVSLAPPLALCLLVPREMGLGALPIIVWSLWSVVQLRSKNLA